MTLTTAILYSGSDFIVWPDGTTCYGDELREYVHLGDDYVRLPFESPAWLQRAEYLGLE